MRFSGDRNFLSMSSEDRALEIRTAEATVAAVGSGRKPYPPREIIAQPGARKSVVTWKPPQVRGNITGYRIYKDTEGSVVSTVSSRETLRYEVNLSSGATPPTTNIFISSVDAGGSESARIQVQCAALAEAGAPLDPQPPAGNPRTVTTKDRSDNYWE